MQTYVTYIKIKWITDLNVRPNAIKVLQENLGKPFFYKNHSNIFLDPSPRVMEIKAETQMGSN